MLVAITLENYALADTVEVAFEQGFNVITGETGAGKSLILDALALCTGARADASKVRHGAPKAELYVEFDISQSVDVFVDWFAEQDMAVSDDILIRRQILANGRSKAWINGQLVNVSSLKQFGDSLIQMHSQHAQTALLKNSYMLDWLDGVANASHNTLALKATMQADWQNYHQLLQQINSSDAERLARKERIRLLQMQLEDVQELTELDYDELEKEHETLSNYEQLMLEASQLLNLLSGEEVSVQQLLSQALRIAEQQEHATFTQANDHLHNAASEIEQALAYMQDFADLPVPDAHKIQELDQQISQFHRLARKYDVKPDELTGLANIWSDELLILESMMDDNNQQQQLAELKDTYLQSAQALDNARQQASPIICEQLLNKLCPLSLENAQCEFRFNKLEEPNAKGVSDIEFVFSANKGMPLQTLNKQASGGELSRLALVMQVLNATDKAQALLVFDEIDVGMSGGTAQIIGELMQDLGKTQQILTITHQAQVAAKADYHLLVTKTHSEEQTHSHIVNIDTEARIQELARMSGGVEITESTLSHAKSLLQT